jgi:Spy/CpxP family protein refolding chaperone
MMKMKSMLITAGVGAALCLGATRGLAQNNGGGNGGNGGGGGGGFQNFRNMSPEERQQFLLDRAKETLEVSDDATWTALKPLVAKVIDARRDAMSGGGGFGGFGRRNRGGGGDYAGGDQGARGGGGGGGGMFGTPSPEREALQKAIDAKASKAEVKAALAKYLDSRKAKQANLEKAQNDLRQVLTSRQEAIAVLSGWL